MKRLFGLAMLATAALASASPLAPPPAYVSTATDVIMASRPNTPAFRQLFANDLTISENGSPVGTGVGKWIAMEASKAGHPTTLGYTSGWDGDLGTLLIIDTYESVDRGEMPAAKIVDSRPITRSVLYQFGADEKIHHVVISSVTSIWRKP